MFCFFPDEDRLSKRKSIGDNISLPPEDESRNSPEKEEVNSHTHTHTHLLHLLNLEYRSKDFFVVFRFHIWLCGSVRRAMVYITI